MEDLGKILQDKKIFFLDRDGTLTLESQMLPGAKNLIQYLTTNEILFYVTTNNSSRTPGEHAESFKKSGLHITPKNIWISSQSALAYLLGRKITELYLVAGREVSNFFMLNGIRHNSRDPQAVLLTYDTELTYKKLTEAIRFINKGVPYFATHSDMVCPTMNGNLPDAGSFIKIIEISTGVLPQKAFGKPEPEFVTGILENHGLSCADAVIIGDRLYTDILLGKNSSITSILVLTGETSRADHEKSDIWADMVVEDIPSLLQQLMVDRRRKNLTAI